MEWSFPEWSDQYDPETQGRAINFLKGGIQTCDRLMTVSEGYAWEMCTVEGGWGLHEVIKVRSGWGVQVAGCGEVGSLGKAGGGRPPGADSGALRQAKCRVFRPSLLPLGIGGRLGLPWPGSVVLG